MRAVEIARRCRALPPPRSAKRPWQGESFIGTKMGGADGDHGNRVRKRLSESSQANRYSARPRSVAKLIGVISAVVTCRAAIVPRHHLVWRPGAVNREGVTLPSRQPAKACEKSAVAGDARLQKINAPRERVIRPLFQ